MMCETCLSLRVLIDSDLLKIGSSIRFNTDYCKIRKYKQSEHQNIHFVVQNVHTITAS